MYMQNLKKIKDGRAVIGIIGLGYVGLPLAKAFNDKNISVLGFDIDENKISILKSNRSYIKHISDELISKMNASKNFHVTTDFAEIKKVDVIIICVPTPLTKNRQPDLGPVIATGNEIAKHLSHGQLVILESSTYPGTTDTELTKILEKSGLFANKDFYLAYSPEREDPGNKEFTTSLIPKVVGGDTLEALELATAVYEKVISSIVPVNKTRTAEAIKLTENIFRSVNIALANELKVVYDAMDIDVWDVIDGAASKPFGFMPFYPGPGLGGHCIPIDPFYLAYKALEYNVPTRFIELAGEINTKMPEFVVSKTVNALSSISKKAINGSKILIIGMAYKKNIDDMRESPSLLLIELLELKGATVDFHDPYINIIPDTRNHKNLSGKKSIKLDSESIKQYDVVIISTDHDGIDYQLISNDASIIIDTRNAMKNFIGNAQIIKA